MTLEPSSRAALLLALVVLPAQAASTPDCAACHEKHVPASAYQSSVHKDLACTACHPVEGPKVAAPDAGTSCVVSFKPTDCAHCHEKQAAEYQGSVHDGQRLPIPCAKCHDDIHALTPHRTDKVAVAKICSSCHSHQADYFESIHFKSLEKGGTDAPTCVDCHGQHAIKKVDNDAAGREFHTRACLTCHDDVQMMERNKVTTIAGETYLASFHGKNVRLGYPEKVAGCADCHSAHGVRKADDPQSTVNAARLVGTCQQCHASAGPAFAQYVAHAEDHDRQKFPALYWTRVGMTALLVGTFLFFWLHSVLWALRSFVDRQRRAALGHEPAPAPSKKSFRRFTPAQIALHLVVIVSFLTLSLTGLPLKFNGTGWGKVVMDFIGGTERARTIHHAAAVITFGYFFTAIAMSLRFLLARRPTGGSFWQRLFGPDSLFPNRRDLADVTAMFKWFFFKGPRPTFERWTYWEKFDFMAVFWGMFAIGLSGLMLWFPEFFSSFLPGWVFNLATIVHSDEALLATGFIFTVHFFNTHFRPEKFPMDTVIFNGRVSHHEMLEERGDQLRRYEAEGRADSLLVEGPPNVLWEFSFRIFGLIAVAIGLSLAAVMAFSLLHGGL
jgi:cytochrome b subunit of formate dehydrogenase